MKDNRKPHIPERERELECRNRTGQEGRELRAWGKVSKGRRVRLRQGCPAVTSLNLVDDGSGEEDAVKFERVVTHSSRETAVTDGE